MHRSLDDLSGVSRGAQATGHRLILMVTAPPAAAQLAISLLRNRAPPDFSILRSAQGTAVGNCALRPARMIAPSSRERIRTTV
jgi:hypothetical protein